jgi:hypothetical protein
MLLRQALEQTRAGMPTPVLFNSSIVVLDPIDEVSAMGQQEVFWSVLRGSAGQVRQGQPHRKAATFVTGAQAS